MAIKLAPIITVKCRRITSFGPRPTVQYATHVRISEDCEFYPIGGDYASIWHTSRAAAHQWAIILAGELGGQVTEEELPC